MEQIIKTISEWVWSPALVVICLMAGLYFSIGTRFVQVRRFREMARLLFAKDKSRNTGVSSFQAFSMALSGRVGTGNIVGVATAIGFGGPGAIVWMWIIAFLGAGSAFSESTLSQIYKEENEGQLRGGPSYYIEKGLKCKWLAVLFAVIAVMACGWFLPSVQSNSIAESFAETFHINPAWIGIVVAVLIGLVIVGGVKRIAKVAEIVAPFMAILYVLLSLVVLAVHIEDVPAVFMDMIRSAFGMNQALGGILGATIAWGVKRGIYSNEAGQGTGAIVAGAAEVSHPVKQGLVQAFSVYVDTLLVCTATAVMILACKTYNVFDASGNILIAAQGVQLGEPEVEYTTAAIGTLLGMEWGGIIISIAMFFFAFTTLMAYYYYAETNLVYLFGKGKMERVLIWLLRVGLVTMVFVGPLYEASVIWAIGDTGVGAMAWINVIAILLLSPKAFKALKSYERQKKEGKEPVFNPEEIGVKEAVYWDKYNSEILS